MGVDSIPRLVLRYGPVPDLATHPPHRWRLRLELGFGGEKDLNERRSQASTRKRRQSDGNNQHQGGHHRRQLLPIYAEETPSPYKPDQARRTIFGPTWAVERKSRIGPRSVERSHGAHSDPLIVEPCALDRRPTWLGIWPHMTECCCSPAVRVERCPGDLRTAFVTNISLEPASMCLNRLRHACTANSRCR